MSDNNNDGVSYREHHQICPKCEQEKQISQTLEETLNILRKTGLTKDQSVSDELYQKRLEACKDCSFLSGGILCTMCGCYIAVRALYIDNECPSPKTDRWINL